MSNFLFRILFLFFILSLVLLSKTHSRPSRSVQEAHAIRITTPPQIDGVLEPEIWDNAMPVREFIQYAPWYESLPSHASDVRIIYDDRAIYIGAILYDSSPDSILRQLGPRDASLNADAFGIRLDTYNNQLDAYTFEVSASGVQRDYRAQDQTYDGVWQSAVKIHEEGWTVEMRIPYSALRFPAVECQNWGFQVYRSIRRTRELNHWSLEEREASNNMINWGVLRGICNIQSPLRLSLTPYFSTTGSHYPHNLEGVSNVSTGIGGGMDLKYGINESFTLDVTLMPDFSQVQSDNVVKNLSAFETVYGEERPFFKETMDLFRRGGLFYSRRIGRAPSGYNRVGGKLEEGEVIVENPRQAKLVNAIKMSGRSRNGLAIGLFNAITDNTYARAENIDGNQRRILTEPATNYSIVVFDQALHSNSNFYLINTNVLRQGDGRHANVTGTGLNLVDRSNSYRISLSGALAQLYNKNDSASNRFSVDAGKRYDVALAKVKGNFRFTLGRNALDPFFNDNDLGQTHRNNIQNDRVELQYNIFEPFWHLRNLRARAIFRNEGRYENNQTTAQQMEFSLNTSTMQYFGMWAGLSFNLQDKIDYYEPRMPGRYYLDPANVGTSAGFTTDYRNPFALDFQFNFQNAARIENNNIGTRITPRYRVNDQFSMVHSLRMNYNFNDVGFAGIDSVGAIVFGTRDVTTIENVFTSDYIVTNDIYFSFRLRQYWSKGEYGAFSKLLDNGHLQGDYPYNRNRDFNFNSFNIDFVFTWLFAPGSSLNVIWKNALLHEKNAAVANYFDNFGLLRDAPQYNSISIKLLYYLDYQQLRRA